MKALFSSVALALLVSASAPLSAGAACGELSIRNAHQAGPVHLDHSFDQMDCEASTLTGVGGVVLSRDVLVTWFHDEGDLTGLSVLLEGPGVSVTLPLAEDVLQGGSTVYSTPVHTLPEGFQGTLTATLLQDGEAIETASARTPL